MSWRDNPRIIWQDKDGDYLAVTLRLMGVGAGDGILDEAVLKPESLADRVEATQRWLAAMGLTADNIRELPRPIEVGDRVVNRDGHRGKVLGGPWDEHGVPMLAVQWDCGDIDLFSKYLLEPVHSHCCSGSDIDAALRATGGDGE